MKRTQCYLVRSTRQLATLAAAARQEIVDVLEQMGTVSVATRQTKEEAMKMSGSVGAWSWS